MTLFRRNFDAELAAEARALEEEGPRVWSETELAAACAKARAEGEATGFAAGHAAGTEAAEAGIAEATRAALEALVPQIDAFTGAAAAHRTTLEAQLTGYVLDVAERVFPEFLDRHGPIHAREQALRLLAQLHDRPALSLHVAPDVAADINARLPELTAAHGTGCAVTVNADETLAPGAARIAWANGFVSIDPERVSRAILTELRRTHAALDPLSQPTGDTE